MKLDNLGNNYIINKKKSFKKCIINEAIIHKSFDFAKQMVFGEGHHRSKRSGGQYQRKNGELFANTLQGKIAEFVTYEVLSKAGLENIKLPDVSVHGLGIWDDSDLEYKDKKINIKSAAFFSGLLLLEAKDWNENGEYIPNLDNSSSQNYDYFVLVRIKPDLKKLFKKHKLFYANKIDLDGLLTLIIEQDWFYDFGGVCTQKTIEYIINHNYFLPQNATLNGNTIMDASNYYIQCGNLKDINWLINDLK